jgi:hypothetical protein
MFRTGKDFEVAPTSLRPKQQKIMETIQLLGNEDKKNT